MKQILVAMSGGVDSSLAAALLVEAGHEVIGATLRTFCYTGEPSHGKSCCGLEGVSDARAVARALGIPHSVFDVEEEFTRDVIDDFVKEYGKGRTPNPCVRCNSFTKFGDLLRRAHEMGADGIATGHYVRMDRNAPGGPSLMRGADREKDQAYFLWGLPRSALPSLHFPLGDHTKAEVRALARDRGLVTADKPESQEICFVPTGDYRDLLRTRLPAAHPAFQPGSIVTTVGEVVGRHGGYANFTVGQRKGLPGGFPEAMFVVAVRPDTREVVVGPKDHMFAEELALREVNWLADPLIPGAEVQVQLRHRARAFPARIESVGDASLGLTLAEPHFAVTPGQSGVLFSDDRVLGGGRISGND
ncbi:MAG: tRNA 2-thiouridine(34) synthase MnmA [Gemmatimonadetes bacterium]|nr:tRNA 2-thiouridine(34) synthase MnmA [Gemmatimonadota bacterium]NNM06996.1 tRNA 2-thiouridine(34) synthase MnmA [Gemmatimonadota bacterium]